MTGFALRDPKSYAGRANDVMIQTPEVMRHSQAKHGTTSESAIIVEQLSRSFLTLYRYGDQSPHFWLPKPMVGGLVAVFFTLGLKLWLSRWREISLLTLGAWFLLTFLLGGVLTSDPPHWPHLNIRRFG